MILKSIFTPLYGGLRSLRRFHFEIAVDFILNQLIINDRIILSNIDLCLKLSVFFELRQYLLRKQMLKPSVKIINIDLLKG